MLNSTENGILIAISNSYTMGCPPVRVDNPRALAYVHVCEQTWYNYFIPLYQCKHCTSRDNSW